MFVVQSSSISHVQFGKEEAMYGECGATLIIHLPNMLLSRARTHTHTYTLTHSYIQWA